MSKPNNSLKLLYLWALRTLQLLQNSIHYDLTAEKRIVQKVFDTFLRKATVVL